MEVFFHENESLWLKLIKCFYGSKGGFGSCRYRSISGSPWSRILHVETNLHEKKVLDLNVFVRKVGDGCNSFFG